MVYMCPVLQYGHCPPTRHRVNALTTGNPFLRTKLLGLNIGRGSGALKGLTRDRDSTAETFTLRRNPLPHRCAHAQKVSRGTQKKSVPHHRRHSFEGPGGTYSRRCRVLQSGVGRGKSI